MMVAHGTEGGEGSAQNGLSPVLVPSLSVFRSRNAWGLRLVGGLPHFSFRPKVFLKKFSPLSGELVGGPDQAGVRGPFEFLSFLVRRQLQALYPDVALSYKPFEKAQRNVLLALRLDGQPTEANLPLQAPKGRKRSHLFPGEGLVPTAKDHLQDLSQVESLGDRSPKPAGI
jgi:hypothetical protein